MCFSLSSPLIYYLHGGIFDFVSVWLWPCILLIWLGLGVLCCTITISLSPRFLHNLDQKGRTVLQLQDSPTGKVKTFPFLLFLVQYLIVQRGKFNLNW
jgi:hypothetical protein